MRAGDTPSAPVQIRAGAALLDGDLTVPPDALGLVVFAHGSGSSRFSSRNRAVATALVRVGGADEPVIALNRSAMLRMDAAQLVIVPGATHLFEERGALEHVAELAVRWCTRHLAPQPAAKKPLTRAAAS